MAHLAYDRFEDQNNPKACELFIAKLEGGGFKLVDTFDSPETDTQAFLARSGDYAVLAFRGTKVTKRQDIMTALTATQISLVEGRVHSGFRAAYKSVKDRIESCLLGMDEIPLYVTSHSLGAALATVATDELEHNPVFKNRIAACYTFGSPRVGDSMFDRHLKSPMYRIVNTTDIVTVIPLLVIGYLHTGDIRFLGRKDGDLTRRAPFLRPLLFLAALFRLFGPWVGDHAIIEYRRKLKAAAEKRTPVFHGH